MFASQHCRLRSCAQRSPSYRSGSLPFWLEAISTFAKFLGCGERVKFPSEKPGRLSQLPKVSHVGWLSTWKQFFSFLEKPTTPIESQEHQETRKLRSTLQSTWPVCLETIMVVTIRKWELVTDKGSLSGQGCKGLVVLRAEERQWVENKEL